ncbi:anti-silencing factor [Volvox carteri f. nagariensis]|uniref:Anti-silencing factor n=1 Tax=Volvox carteri f. nagariensis TaxID=3068 RepID=D8U2U1_VOLCA|nr:anti-silencing factor [Volvox carteri f. nagariensis]EFJ45864.1 anti-silencing factor [Volvox carteri f. nagariensis]|eukprot:XP_002952942.1 anti-silencing factor [Volvox carteri f. nagariensis]
MAVSVLSVRPLNNPAMFTDPLAFEIEYEAVTSLQQDLVWKLVYVGSADSDRYDQELENIEVGPVMAGTFKFVLEANPPNPQKIPADDLVGVTVILLTCSYRDKEFIRVGYYVNNDYLDEELRENPPEQPRLDRLQRSILDEHPRVTRYAIPFDDPEPADGAQPMDEDGSQPMQGTESADAMMTAPPLQATAFQSQPGMFDGHAQQAGPQQMYHYVPVQ